MILKGKHTAELIHGDSIDILPTLKGGYSMVIADPPYASGGNSMSEKQRSTGKKYAHDSNFPDFEGDAKDQRSFTSWSAHWMNEARNLSNQGAIIAVFTDWRQLPCVTDALQWAGWLWRGILPWDKINSRPQIGRFKQQTEFIVWGSKGSIPCDRKIGVLPGMYAYPSVIGPKRKHQTEKPLKLMCDLIRICPEGGRLLDPFMGSGVAEEASLIMGHDCTGIEKTGVYFGVSVDRIQGYFATEAGRVANT